MCGLQLVMCGVGICRELQATITPQASFLLFPTYLGSLVSLSPVWPLPLSLPSSLLSLGPTQSPHHLDGLTQRQADW